MPTADTDAALARRRAMAKRLAGLYAVTPDLAETPLLVARVEAALEGGACAIQYRNKSADATLKRIQAASLAGICTARSGLFMVNDDARLAAAVGADGVHLGEDDGSIAAAREIVGPDGIIGVSCYNDFALARAAVAAGADYVAFGSFHASSVKPGARRTDVALLGRAALLGVPVVAIGGITAANAGALRIAGADAVAVISAVFGAGKLADIKRAAHAIAAVFRASHARA